MRDQIDLDRPQLASDVAARYAIRDEAAACLRADATPQQFFAELARRELYRDAVEFAANYLAPREAVWWGCLCVWQVFREQPPANEKEALDAVVRWVEQPDETQRRKAYAAAREAGSLSVAANLGLAAFYCGGSISLPDQPHVDPPAGQTAKCVAAAVMLASTKVPHQFKEACLVHFLKLAGEVSRGEAGWELEKEPASDAPGDGELQHVRES